MSIKTKISERLFLCSWSGGKDSYLALHKARLSGANPLVLLNVLNENGQISRSHGIPKKVLERQASCLGLPLEFIESSWQDYEKNFIDKLITLKSKYGVNAAVYGDIDIESHRKWDEKVSKAAEVEPVLPLWQVDRRTLVEEMIKVGIEALIVSCQSKYEQHILGEVITTQLLDVFEQLEIDACGENGEYHTLVLNGPEHKEELVVEPLNVLRNNGYSFLELSYDN